MSALLIGNIGQIITNSDKELGILEKAALVVENQKVVWVGSNESAPATDNYLDAENGVVTPGFVDSHTHAIFAGDRSRDYVARMSGNKYATGGIKTTVAATRDASDVELKLNLQKILQYSKLNGTTTIEIKSGYGLDIASEVKILKIAKEYTSETTFLGAHVVPDEYSGDRSAYVNLVKGEMLDAVLPYAKWVDVFCDTGAFTVDEAREILKSGMAKGLMGRIHGNQLGDTGGVELALELGLASVDHASHISDASIEALANSEVVTTFLPGAEFFTKSAYPNAKKLLELGATVALATDCNPGSSFITSMPIVMAMAIRDMGFTPAQAMAAATLGGAKALKRADIGYLTAGAKADIIIWQAPTYEHIPYRMGEINKKILTNGQIQ
jgi:imidazolonepropionase